MMPLGEKLRLKKEKAKLRLKLILQIRREKKAISILKETLLNLMMVI